MNKSLRLRSRKAEAQIISELLLVAIAVVGGIMVFVWTTGAYKSNSSVELPRTESIQIIGYDTRDTASLTGLSTINNGASGSGKLVAGSEYIVLKLRNAGNTDIKITKIIIMGVEHTWHGAITAPATTAPDAGKFQVYSKISGNPQNVDRNSPSLAPGEDARVAAKLSSSLPDDIQIGRNLPVEIETSNGSFNFSVVTDQTE